MKLRMSTSEECEKIMTEVIAWFEDGYRFSTPSKVKVRFNNAQSTAKLAVAEYVANQKGLTLFPEREGDLGDK